MSRTRHDEPNFSGTSGSEVDCDDVLRYVRKQALAEGKLGNDLWMTQLLASCLSKTALRWYEDLEEETQMSWKLLRKAMLLRWPDDEELDDDRGRRVVAAAAPIPAPTAPPSSFTPITP